jgi:hypothetical protein
MRKLLLFQAVTQVVRELHYAVHVTAAYVTSLTITSWWNNEQYRCVCMCVRVCVHLPVCLQPPRYLRAPITMSLFLYLSESVALTIFLLLVEFSHFLHQVIKFNSFWAYNLKWTKPMWYKNASKVLPDYTASHPKRYYSSQSPLWEPHTINTGTSLLMGGGEIPKMRTRTQSSDP